MLGLTEKNNAYTVISTTGSILDRGAYILDSTAGPITIKLPLNPDINGNIIVADGFGSWGANNVTLDRNGHDIIGPTGAPAAEDLVLNVRGMQLTILYTGTAWRLM